MELVRICPGCGAMMEEQDLGFWRCPICSGEWWPADEVDEQPPGAISTFEAHWLWQEEQRDKARAARQGGARTRGRFRNRKQVPFVPWYQRYLLYS